MEIRQQYIEYVTKKYGEYIPKLIDDGIIELLNCTVIKTPFADAEINAFFHKKYCHDIKQYDDGNCIASYGFYNWNQNIPRSEEENKIPNSFHQYLIARGLDASAIQEIIYNKGWHAWRRKNQQLTQDFLLHKPTP